MKLVMEEKRPLTRNVLDDMINKVEKELNGSIARKDYNACPPLQSKLNDLLEKRNDFPTIEELVEKLRMAEKAVSDAASSRDFASAAKLQAAVDNAKANLEQAMLDEDTDVIDDTNANKCEERMVGIEKSRKFTSREELEVEITTVMEKLNDAIKNKDFKNATLHQSSLDGLEFLRFEYPSLDELKATLLGKEKEMESAIDEKDFIKASSLNNEIEDIQEKIKMEQSTDQKNMMNFEEGESSSLNLEDGSVLRFKSRMELENEIKEREDQVLKAAEAKLFSEATSKQLIVEKLEALREKLPTLNDLRQQLLQKKEQMAQAIKQKEFSRAQEFDNEISDIQHRIKREENCMKIDKKENLIEAATTIKRHQKNTVIKPLTLKRNSTVQTSNKDRPLVAKMKRNVPDLIACTTTEIRSVLSSKKSSSTKKVVEAVREVSKLRPKKPLISNHNDSILAVSQMLANKRGSASLVIGSNGGLAGILTDTDVTRRVVAKNLKPAATKASEVMTANPTVVAMKDSAMDALTTMVENHFRHLPVVDDDGAVVGVLDIAKCLNDAIRKLEKAQEKSSSAAEDAVKQMASLQGAGGGQAAMLTQLLGPLMAQAFGNQSSPTLRSLLAGKPLSVVAPSTSVFDTGSVMAEARKAALVVDNGALVGIFGFKDMMSRVVAKELPLEYTSVQDVMTPSPESVSPDMTVVDALQVMHENKFLNLPVCESDGTVCGLVGVMDLIHGCGGAEGWRSLFDSAMELGDDASDTVSHYSAGTRSVVSSKKSSSPSSIALSNKERQPSAPPQP